MEMPLPDSGQQLTIGTYILHHPPGASHTKYLYRGLFESTLQGIWMCFCDPSLPQELSSTSHDPSGLRDGCRARGWGAGWWEKACRAVAAACPVLRAPHAWPEAVTDDTQVKSRLERRHACSLGSSTRSQSGMDGQGNSWDDVTDESVGDGAAYPDTIIVTNVNRQTYRAVAHGLPVHSCLGHRVHCLRLIHSLIS
ncbi:hypothetical protein CSOJ01_09622 [Colletotrichum sojae]|uniref:Uncharacterized protein n=1 Tax=Colletotrichum sojae TaxID=2175907 RepID=A0A8H6MR73_9PEZI|nr:hypothetical protein CSOJ01_09622 [Colletotrichum sojae]